MKENFPFSALRLSVQILWSRQLKKLLFCYSIDANLNVKLCDSALSSDIFPEDYTNIGDGDSKPIKWMSIESLTDARYSYHTDTVSQYSITAHQAVNWYILL